MNVLFTDSGCMTEAAPKEWNYRLSPPATLLSASCPYACSGENAYKIGFGTPRYRCFNGHANRYY